MKEEMLLWPHWPIYDEKELSALQKALECGEWSRGKAIEEFERRFADFCGVKYCLLVNSGTEALKIAIRALNIGPGDEVIVPGLTWPSTAIAVMESGAKAVMVDIEPDSYSICPKAVLNSITDRTKAVIAVHLYNSSADVETILKICKDKNISLIEDSAQVHGCKWKGKQLGTFGCMGAFSFHQKKLMTCGEGGCIVTDNLELYQQAYSIRDHGAKLTSQSVERYGGNSRISAISAALLGTQLERLSGILNREENSAKILEREIKGIDGIACLKRRDEITLQSHYSFCIRLVDKELSRKAGYIRARMTEVLGVKFDTSYPPLNDTAFFKPHVESLYKDLAVFMDLSNCNKAYECSIRFPHQVLLAPRNKIIRIAQVLRELAEGET